VNNVGIEQRTMMNLTELTSTQQHEIDRAITYHTLFKNHNFDTEDDKTRDEKIKSHCVDVLESKDQSDRDEWIAKYEQLTKSAQRIAILKLNDVTLPKVMDKKKSKKGCSSCKDGWWCRGCGSYDKKQAMKQELGMTDDEADAVIAETFGSCGYLVKCYVCSHRDRK
jgi:hypothetical protein